MADFDEKKNRIFVFIWYANNPNFLCCAVRFSYYLLFFLLFSLQIHIREKKKYVILVYKKNSTMRIAFGIFKRSCSLEKLKENWRLISNVIKDKFSLERNLTWKYWLFLKIDWNLTVARKGIAVDEKYGNWYGFICFGGNSSLSNKETN